MFSYSLTGRQGALPSAQYEVIRTSPGSTFFEVLSFFSQLSCGRRPICSGPVKRDSPAAGAERAVLRRTRTFIAYDAQCFIQEKGARQRKMGEIT